MRVHAHPKYFPQKSYEYNLIISFNLACSMTLSRNGIPSSPWMWNILSLLVLSTRSWSFLQCCWDSRKIETLSFFAHGGGSFETQVKKLSNDRNSEMDLRHANEYDKLGQDWGYATFLSGPWAVFISILKKHLLPIDNAGRQHFCDLITLPCWVRLPVGDWD